MVYLCVDSESNELATTTGWYDVKKWGDKLHLSNYTELVTFLEHGISQDVSRLLLEAKLGLARAENEGESYELLTTLRHFISLIPQNTERIACVFISNGMSSEDGEDDFMPSHEPEGL